MYYLFRRRSRFVRPPRGPEGPKEKPLQAWFTLYLDNNVRGAARAADGIEFGGHEFTAGVRSLGIFCTEPFRIQFAGAVDVCCFDKTGTLTSDELTARGGALSSEFIDDKANLPADTFLVLASCHAVSKGANGLLGDSPKGRAAPICRRGPSRQGPRPETIRLLVGAAEDDLSARKVLLPL